MSKGDISLYDAAQIAMQCLTLPDLPDSELTPAVLMFDGKGLESNWKEFKERVDMDDPKVQGILKVVFIMEDYQ